MRKTVRAWLATSLLLAVSLQLAASDAVPQPKRGEAPPDEVGRDRNGEPVTVSQHKGKVVIVTFWASWCGPCQRELPVLGKLQKLVGREHLEVIAVNLKEPRRDFLSVVRANKDIDLTYVHDQRGEAAGRYGVNSVPNMFVIDRDGKVVQVHRGYSAEMIDDFVQEMLALLPAEVLSRPAGG